MARGNQRDLSREKNLKKLAAASKGGGDAPKTGGVNTDAIKLAEKRAKKEADKLANAGKEAEAPKDRVSASRLLVARTCPDCDPQMSSHVLTCYLCASCAGV